MSVAWATVLFAARVSARGQAPATAPATAPTTAPAANVVNEPGRSSLGKSLSFRVDANRLSVRWAADAANGQAPQPRQVVRRPTGKLIVQPPSSARIGQGVMLIGTIPRQGAAGGPAGYYQLQVPREGDGKSFTISGQNLYTPLAGVYGINVSSDGQRLRASVTRIVPAGVGRTIETVMSATARDFRQLAADQPEAVRVFLGPAMLELTGIDCFPPDAGDVYRAFGAIPADPEVAAAVSRLLPALDADDFQERSRAARELAATGDAGVLAAMRCDRRGLSPTQRSALDGFVAARTLDSARTPAAALADPEFLIQCAAHGDPAVRQAAAAVLSKLAGRDVKLEGEGGSAGPKPGDSAALRGMLLDVLYPGATIAADPPEPDQTSAFAFGAFDEAAQRAQAKQMRAMEPQLLARHAKGKTYARADLFQVKRVNGLPQVRWAKKFTVDAPTRVGVKGSAGEWLIYRAGEFRPGNTDVTLAWSDATRGGDEGPWKIHLNFSNDYFFINAQYGENATMTNASVNIVNGRIMFSAGRDAVGRPALQGQAASLGKLTERHPEVVRKYLGPIFRDLFGIYVTPPEAGTVYAVFDQLPPDEGVAKRLAEEIVPQLDAADAADRAAAIEALQGLGTPGVVAALRFDRDGLTFEQDRRLIAFLAARGWRGAQAAEDRAALTVDVPFLLACLEFEDAAVRAAALNALQEAVGPVDLDVTLPPEKLSAAVETLREKLEAAHQEAK